MPYLRAAYEWDWNSQALHVGALYMQSNVNPVSGTFMTDGSMGRDHYTDYAFDGGYQYLGDGTHIVTVQGIYIHENQNLEGTTTAFNNANGTSFGPKSSLNQIRMNVSYWYQNTYGVTFGWQNTWGPANPVLYTTGSRSDQQRQRQAEQQRLHHRGGLGAVRQGGLVGGSLGQPEAGHPVYHLYAVQRRQQKLRRLRSQRERQQYAVHIRLDGVLRRRAVGRGHRSPLTEMFKPFVTRPPGIVDDGTNTAHRAPANVRAIGKL